MNSGITSNLFHVNCHLRLKLTHITVCEGLRETLDLAFDSICVEQLIGKCLFREFLDANEEAKKASKVIQHFMDPSAKYYCPFLSEDIKTKVKESHETVGDHLFAAALAITLGFLREAPYIFFLESMYLKRFLQWKWLEMQPMDADWFLDFHVLGRGGFGEVSACQMKFTWKLYAGKKLNKKRLQKLVEKRILDKVHSCLIVSLAYAFQTKNELCLIITIMNGGDLRIL
uniref:G protein-coupled receptor kinase n=1 Tax=Monopterus albus TaxID=43700 RepID=A0A3Q3QAK4_MONAL